MSSIAEATYDVCGYACNHHCCADAQYHEEQTSGPIPDCPCIQQAGSNCGPFENTRKDQRGEQQSPVLTQQQNGRDEKDQTANQKNHGDSKELFSLDSTTGEQMRSLPYESTLDMSSPLAWVLPHLWAFPRGDANYLILSSENAPIMRALFVCLYSIQSLVCASPTPWTLIRVFCLSVLNWIAPVM